MLWLGAKVKKLLYIYLGEELTLFKEVGMSIKFHDQTSVYSQ